MSQGKANQSEYTNKKELSKAIVNYRVKCDVAYSELKDKVYTQKEYYKAIQWELDQVLALIKSRESALLSRAKELVGKTKGVKELYPDVDTNKRDDKLWEAIFKKDGYNQAITEVRTKLDQLSKENRL